jgi:serine protease AprX
MRLARCILVIGLLLAVSSAGCLGAEARSEWAFSSTGLDDAYDAGARGTGIRIAVLDTGINVDHPALTHLVDGSASNGELVAFRDFVGDRSGLASAYDDAGHGSHVAGIISARGSSFGDKLTNGGVDLLGASPGAVLIVAKVCSEDQCNNGQIASAIAWAVAQGADIISLSLGGPGGLSDLQQAGLFEDAITREINDAIDGGVVVIAAAGNEPPGANDVAFPGVIEGVISVGAMNEAGRVATFSVHGDGAANTCSERPLTLPGEGRCSPHQKPEIVAPGTDILSAWKGSLYVRASGTSQATPFVTAAVALMLEGKVDLNSRADVYEIKTILRTTSALLEGQQRPHDNGAGYGLLQADRAIEAY